MDKVEKEIQEYSKYGIKNFANNGNLMTIEANYNEFVKDNGFIRFGIDGKCVILKKEHLKSILFLIGSNDDKDEIIDVEKEIVNYQPMVIKMIATKDIPKGGTVQTTIQYPKLVRIKKENNF